jgi:hypothetical protein
MNEYPEVLEHSSDHNFRSSYQNCDRENNVQQVNHWNVIPIVFHVGFSSQFPPIV